VSRVVISTATRTPRTTTWSVNYWDWMPTLGDDVTGTDALVAALKPTVMRIAGTTTTPTRPILSTTPSSTARLPTLVRSVPSR